MSTKYPYGRRRSQHAAAYEKDVRAAHQNILLYRRQIADFETLLHPCRHLLWRMK